MPETRSASEVVAAVKISAIYTGLTGVDLRSSTQDHYRAPAPWREGKEPSVSLDDTKGMWYDHKTNEGGGKLDLVARATGCSRQEALRWVSNFAGIPLSQASPAAIGDMRQAKRDLDRDLPDAQLWRRSAVGIGEELLGTLKESLWSTDEKLQPRTGEVAEWTRRIARWRSLDGAALVAEYRDWLDREPDKTAAMVRASRIEEARQTREIAALAGLSKRSPWQHAGPDFPAEDNRPERSVPWLEKQRDLDAIVEEVILKTDAHNKGAKMNEPQNLKQSVKPAAELTTAQLAAEDLQLHERYEQLKDKYQKAAPEQKEEIRREMIPIVTRETEIRSEFGSRPPADLVVDRVPQQDIGISR